MSVIDHDTGEIVTDLVALEAVIERGLSTFIEVGTAITEIRNGRRYEEAGYPTFQHYCQRRWGWSTSRARQLMSAAATAEAIKGVTDVTPQTEADVRRLNPLPADERAEAWAEAVEAAGGEQPTAAQVQAAVDKRKPPTITVTERESHSVTTTSPATPSGDAIGDASPPPVADSPDDEARAEALDELIGSDPDYQLATWRVNFGKAVGRLADLALWSPAEVAAKAEHDELEFLDDLISSINRWHDRVREQRTSGLQLVKGGRA